MSDNRPARYMELDDAGNETVIYRASSVGGCEKAMLAAARGYDKRDHPDWFQEVLDEGSRMEEHIIAKWDFETGRPTVNQQKQIELYVGEIDGRNVIIRGHIDGEDDHENPALREYKKFRPSTWDKFIRQGVECGANYPWQVAIYMHGGGYDLCQFVGGKYNPDTDSIDEVEAHAITNPPIPMKAIRTKIARVERMINQGYDPMDDGVECTLTYPCGYFYLHGQGAAPPATPHREISVADESVMWDAIADYKVARSLAAELRKQMDAAAKAADLARSKIIGELSAAGAEPGELVSFSGWEAMFNTVPRAGYTVKPGTTTKFTITHGDN